MNEKNSWILGIIVGIFIIWIVGTNLGLFSAASSSVSRSLPTEVLVGTYFNVTYTASSPDAKWGGSIQDSLSGCNFESGSTQLKAVLLSTVGNSKTYRVLAPSTAGTCTFTGDYQFGNNSVVSLPIQTVTIKSAQTVICTTNQTKCEGLTSFTCSNNAWISNGLVNGKCGYTTPANNSNQTNQTAQTYYRLSNSNCTAMMLYPAQKTSNDYLTMSECQSKIGTESFWSKEIFNMGGFSVTGLILIIMIGLALLILKLIVGK